MSSAEYGTERGEPWSCRPLRVDEWRAAGDRAFAWYAADPWFLELYGASDAAEVEGARPVMHGNVTLARQLPGTSLGCFVGKRQVGIATYLPAGPHPRMSWRSHPFAMAKRGAAGVARRWQYRDRLRGRSRARWREYIRLANQHRKMLEDRYTMMVSVLAVDPRHRRRGVARRLLERVAAEERWQVEWLQVTTWCPRNVDIYEQLGFSVFAHDEGDEVACWTMLRPGPDHEPDVGHPPTGSP